jgi:phytoene/squalene synthetase
VHTYRSPIYLPPDLDGYAERGSGVAGLALAALWIIVAGTVIFTEQARLGGVPAAV